MKRLRDARRSLLLGTLIGLLTRGAAFAEQSPPALSAAVVQQLEARLSLPRGSEALDHYARFYTATRAKTVDDLPFSTIFDGVPLRRGQPLVLGIFALPHKWGPLTIGPRIVRLSAFPQFVHGGCWAVNVVYDPVHERMLGVWCNYADRAPPPRP
jgi:hypothetical protein